MTEREETLGKRLMSAMTTVAELHTMHGMMSRIRDSIMQEIATLARVDGFVGGVTGPTNIDGMMSDITITWEKKDHKHGITKAEREEIGFRTATVCKMGFKALKPHEGPHDVRVRFQVKL